VQLRFRISNRAPANPGDLIVLEAFDVMENEHGPGTGWQLCNRAIESQAIDHAGETEVPRSRLPVMTLRLIVAFIHFLDGSNDVGLPTEAHQDDIYGEPVQPSGERGIAAKTSDLSKQLKKGILR
jgi:hypothetical protein